jgi:hypothetical protein
MSNFDIYDAPTTEIIRYFEDTNERDAYRRQCIERYDAQLRGEETSHFDLRIAGFTQLGEPSEVYGVVQSLTHNNSQIFLVDTSGLTIPPSQRRYGEIVRKVIAEPVLAESLAPWLRSTIATTAEMAYEYARFQSERLLQPTSEVGTEQADLVEAAKTSQLLLDMRGLFQRLEHSGINPSAFRQHLNAARQQLIMEGTVTHRHKFMESYFLAEAMIIRREQKLSDEEQEQVDAAWAQYTTSKFMTIDVIVDQTTPYSESMELLLNTVRSFADTDNSVNNVQFKSSAAAAFGYTSDK